MKQDILNLENKNVGSIELNDAIFGLDVRAVFYTGLLIGSWPACKPAPTRPKAVPKLL